MSGSFFNRPPYVLTSELHATDVKKFNVIFNEPINQPVYSTEPFILRYSDNPVDVSSIEVSGNTVIIESSGVQLELLDRIKLSYQIQSGVDISKNIFNQYNIPLQSGILKEAVLGDQIAPDVSLNVVSLVDGKLHIPFSESLMKKPTLRKENYTITLFKEPASIKTIDISGISNEILVLEANETIVDLRSVVLSYAPSFVLSQDLTDLNYNRVPSYTYTGSTDVTAPTVSSQSLNQSGNLVITFNEDMRSLSLVGDQISKNAVSYTHLRAHET